MHPLKKDEKAPIEEDVYKDKKGKMFLKSQYAKDYELKDVLRNDGTVWWVPNYVIKSPKECKSILVDPKELKFRVLMIHKDKSELKGTNVLKYIQWGESQGYNTRPTCKSRKRWYDLGNRMFAPILWTEFFFERAISYVNPFGIYESDKFYGITPKIDDELGVMNLSSYLNSTLIPLFRLIGGFQSLGEGVLKMPVYEVASFPVTDPKKVSNKLQSKLKNTFTVLDRRETKMLDNEIGASSPEEVSLDKVKPDRRELDKIVMGEILGLTEEEQLEVYRAVIDLVKSRIEKAKSVKKNSKKKGKEDEILAKRILDSIGGEDIIRDFLDGFKKKKEINLPDFKKELKVEKSLFGWNLTDGKQFVEFETWEEAEFCRLMALLGARNFSIPLKVKRKDVRRLDALVEIIFNAMDEILDSISDRKLKNSIINKVLSRIVT